MFSMNRVSASLVQSPIAICCLAALFTALFAPVARAQVDPKEISPTNNITKSFDRLALDARPAHSWRATSRNDHLTWRVAAEAKMKQLLGRMPEPASLETKWEEKKVFDKFTRHKVYVRTEQAYWAPVYFFVPHGLKKPVPAMVCLHGHSGIYPYIREGRTESERKATVSGSLDYAVHFAEHGYVTAAIVVRGWNETSGFQDRGVSRVNRSCHQVTMNAFLLGMTPQGLRCHDAMRVIDFLESRKEVDKNRIGVAGLSGGGTLASYLPILEPRIKLVMIGGAFSTYRQSIYAMPHCICNCLPGVLEYGEMADVIALHAPRPVLIINGINDPIFPIAGAHAGFEKLQRVYQLLGVPDRIEADFFDGPHAWSNNKTVTFLKKHFGQ